MQLARERTGELDAVDDKRRAGADQ